MRGESGNILVRMSLGLEAVGVQLDSLLKRAARKKPIYTEFLDELPGCEFTGRAVAGVSGGANPLAKLIDSGSWAHQPGVRLASELLMR